MEEKHSGIRCEKGDIIRIKGLGETASVVFLAPCKNIKEEQYEYYRKDL